MAEFKRRFLALVAVLAILGMLLPVFEGCSGDPPTATPDVPATVAARVVLSIEAIPVPTPTPTPTPIPTPTPTSTPLPPPTPTPTATPLPGLPLPMHEAHYITVRGYTIMPVSTSPGDYWLDITVSQPTGYSSPHAVDGEALYAKFGPHHLTEADFEAFTSGDKTTYHHAKVYAIDASWASNGHDTMGITAHPESDWIVRVTPLPPPLPTSENIECWDKIAYAYVGQEEINGELTNHYASVGLCRDYDAWRWE